jgi:hypothetical protein
MRIARFHRASRRKLAGIAREQGAGARSRGHQPYSVTGLSIALTQARKYLPTIQDATEGHFAPLLGCARQFNDPRSIGRAAR